jgi:predicted RecA/RadA family phage recombinase
MKNLIQEGLIITAAAPYDRLSGEGALLGSLFAVAMADVLNAASGEWRVAGVFDLAKVSTEEWTVGAKVYWDNSNKRCTTVATDGQLIGVAMAVTANPSTTGAVRLNGVAPAASEGPQGAIVDLTDSTGQSGTHDDTLAATTVPTQTSANPSAITAAAGEATAADLTLTQALEGQVSAVVVDIAAILTLLTVMAQNASDSAQKIKELRAAMVAHGVIAAA